MAISAQEDTLLCFFQERFYTPVTSPKTELFFRGVKVVKVKYRIVALKSATLTTTTEQLNQEFFLLYTFLYLVGRVTLFTRVHPT